MNGENDDNIRKPTTTTPFHWLIFLFYVYVQFLTCANDLFPIFLNYSPDWTCWQRQENLTTTGLNGSTKSNYGRNCSDILHCRIHDGQQLEFETEYDSLLTEYPELNCGPKSVFIPAITTVQQCGVLIGSISAGLASDRYGRKPTLLADFLGLIGAGFAGYFVVPSYTWLIPIRFVAGLCYGGTYFVGIVYCAELVLPRHRLLMKAVFNWGLSRLLFTGCCWLWPSWQGSLLGIHALTAPGVLFFAFGMPESPMWLRHRAANSGGGCEENDDLKRAEGRIEAFNSAVCRLFSCCGSWKKGPDKNLPTKNANPVQQETGSVQDFHAVNSRIPLVNQNYEEDMLKNEEDRMSMDQTGSKCLPNHRLSVIGSFDPQLVTDKESYGTLALVYGSQTFPCTPDSKRSDGQDSGFLDLFRDREMAQIVMTICFCSFSMKVSALVNDLNSKNLHGNLFLNQTAFSLICALSKPVLVILDLSIRQFDRRLMHQIPQALIILIFAYLFVADAFDFPPWIILIPNLIGTVFIDYMFAAIELCCAEQVPTLLRSKASGLSGVFFCIGGMVSPSFAYLAHLFHPSPFAVVALIGIPTFAVSYRYLKNSKHNDMAAM